MNKKVHIFRSFLISYLVIIIIPFLIGSLIYHEAVKIVKKDAYNTYLSLLEQSVEIIDRRLEEIESMVTGFAYNSKIRSLLYLEKPLDTNVPYKILEAWKDLGYYDLSNDFFDSFQLYFKNMDVIMDPEAIYMRVHDFYGVMFKYGDLDYNEWKNEFLYRYHMKEFMPSSPIMINDKTHSMITYVQSIPQDVPGRNSGTVMVYIKESEVHKLLSRMYVNEGGWVYISDKNGTIISSDASQNIEILPIHDMITENNGQTQLPSKSGDLTITYKTSSLNGWVYVVAVPTEALLNKVNYIRQITILIALATFIVGLTVSSLLAYRNSRPIRKLLSFIPDMLDAKNIQGNNAYDMLENTLTQLYEKNSRLQKSLEEQKPILKRAVFERLLKGDIFSEREMQALLTYTGVLFSGNSYVVLLIHLIGYQAMLSDEILKELDMKRVIVRGLLESMVKENFFALDVHVDTIAALFSCNNDHKISFYTMVEGMVTKMKAELSSHGIDIVCTGGNIYHKLIDVSSSYHEAKKAWDSLGDIENITIAWYSEIPVITDMYYYPVDIELRLMNLSKAGEKDGVASILQYLYEENFIKRKLSNEMPSKLLNEMQETINKTVHEINHGKNAVLLDIIKKTQIEYNAFCFEDRYGVIKKLYMEICETVDQLKDSHNTKMKNKVLEFLELDYANPDMSLLRMAENIGVSLVYMSKFFKEQTGENFSSCLERLRIQKASLLLTETELSIEEIATKVGYGSAHAFRRAFKRIDGLSPSVYRESKKLDVDL